MRLWSLHPHYLDKKGLCGLWAEACMAQKVLLQGEYTVCSNCNGAREYKYFDDKIQNKVWETCPKCKGVGKIKTPYYNHPQLIRFKIENGNNYLIWYLYEIYLEGRKRNYKFNLNLIKGNLRNYTGLNRLTVTKGQLVFEFEHLQKKLAIRAKNKHKENHKLSLGEDFIMDWKDYKIKIHPLFEVIKGEKENWEKGGE